MEWLSDTQWLLWLAAALDCGMIEIVSLDFFFLDDRRWGAGRRRGGRRSAPPVRCR